MLLEYERVDITSQSQQHADAGQLEVPSLSMLAMMDNNENENYCYQQQQQPSAKTGSVNKGAIPKANAFKYQNQFNNNNNIAEQENLMPHANVPLQKSTDSGDRISTNGPGTYISHSYSLNLFRPW